MKKILSILLLTFYLAVSSVSAINLHYCQGYLVDLSINSAAESCCDNETRKTSSCCKDINLQIDLNDDQQTNSSIQLEQLRKHTIFFATVLLDVNAISENYNTPSPVINDPPGGNYSKIYLITNSFLFYS